MSRTAIQLVPPLFMLLVMNGCLHDGETEKAGNSPAPATRYTLTVTLSGSGSVSSMPVGIDCGSDCSEALDSDTAITLTATPASGFSFSGWSGACTGTAASCAVTMSANQAVTATFLADSTPSPPPPPPPPPTLFGLTVTVVGTGSVSSTPAGVGCPGDCNENYASGTSVTLTATPGANQQFSGWSNACGGTSTTCTLNMSQNRTAVATFAPVQPTLSVTVSGIGTVTSNVGGINCGNACSAALAPNTAVELTATAGNGYTFGGWSGTGISCGGTGACTVQMTQSRSVLATFTSTSGDLLLFDNFEYVAGRDDPNVVAVFQQHGWSHAKTQQTGVGNPRGYLHTVNQIPGYAGAFPGIASNRVLAMDILPTLPNRDGTNPTGSQTDFYLQYGNGEDPASAGAVPGNVWFQFWMYINYYGDQLSGFDRRNKFIYPCNGPYPCSGGNIKWLMSIEPGSYIPHWYEIAVPAQGEVFFATHIDRTNSTITSPDTADYDQGKLGQTNLTHPGPNQWTLVKINIDTSTQFGSYRAWIRPLGGSWIQIADFRHGVDGFSWVVNQIGGHRTFRMPTTLGSGNPDQPRWDAYIYVDDFAMSRTEAALPQY